MLKQAPDLWLRTRLIVLTTGNSGTAFALLLGSGFEG